MTLQDSIFYPIYEQTSQEFMNIINNFPKNIILYTHLKTYSLLKRYFYTKELIHFFTKLKIVENNSQLENITDILLFLPNDIKILREIFIILSNFQNLKINIIFFPKYGIFCQNFIEQKSLNHKIKVYEFHLDIILLDSYSFLVPNQNTFRKLYINGDIDDLTSISRSLVKIEILNGIFPKIYSFGKYSHRIIDIIREMKTQIGINAFNVSCTFDHLIVFDRSVDLLTPLLTQFTYGGMIDETFPNHFGVLELPSNIEWQNREILLSDIDEVYRDIKSSKLSDAGSFLLDAIKDIASIGTKLVKGMDMALFKIQALKAKSLADRKPYFSLHLSLLENITSIKNNSDIFLNAIRFEFDTLIGMNPTLDLLEKSFLLLENWSEIIRLYCIMSQVNNGLPTNIYNFLIKRLISHFGFNFLNTLEEFETLKLIIPQKPTNLFDKNINSFQNLSKNFNLLPKDQTIESKKLFCTEDIGNSYDGYIPLISRITQSCINGDIESNEKQKILNFYGIDMKFNKIDLKNISIEPHPVKKILVFIIGGITTSELLSLREVGKKLFQGSIDINIGSTTIINSNNFLKENFLI